MLSSRLGALREEWDAVLLALRDRRLALLLGALALLLLLAAQAPLVYRIEVGQEDGPGADLPLISGVWPPEHDVHGDFRWTRSQAELRLPGLGWRAVQLTLRVFPVNDEVARRGPQELELWAAGRRLGALPVFAQGRTYHVLLPPAPAGDQLVAIRSQTIVPTGDERNIGTPIDAVALAYRAGPTIPAWRSLLLWLLGALLAWLAVRRAGFGPWLTLALLAPAVLLLGLAALLDPPRTALGAQPAAVALGLGWLLVLLLRRAAPPLLRRAAVPLDQSALRWLLLLALLVFGLRYGGKLYPDSMPGDIGFHANRYADVVRGTVLLLSRNRGVDFPYPPAFYLLLAPFSLLGLDRRVLLQLGGALLDALSPFLIYCIGQVIGRPRPPALADFPIGLVAAGIYSLSAAGFMTTWWNFSTHIFAQCLHLLLITLLVLVWSRADGRPLVGSVLLLLAAQALVYLGHFGFWVNMSLLGGLALAVLLWRWRAGLVAGRLLAVLLGGFVLAQLTALVLFYSAYIGLFLGQAQATASGGLTGLAGRAAVPLDILWYTLWDSGLRVHFGFFPVPLAVGGLVLIWRRVTLAPPDQPADSRAVAVALLMSVTAVISMGFAVLPFLTRSTLSTRWLMFAAWSVAVGAAYACAWLWERGLLGRFVVGLVGSYMVWITLSQWLAALAWRVRPPEPF